MSRQSGDHDWGATYSIVLTGILVVGFIGMVLYDKMGNFFSRTSIATSTMEAINGNAPKELNANWSKKFPLQNPKKLTEFIETAHRGHAPLDGPNYPKNEALQFVGASSIRGKDVKGTPESMRGYYKSKTGRDVLVETFLCGGDICGIDIRWN